MQVRYPETALGLLRLLRVRGSRKATEGVAAMGMQETVAVWLSEVLREEPLVQRLRVDADDADRRGGAAHPEGATPE